MVGAGEFDDPDALTSTDEAAKPIEASDNVSARNFFMFLFLSRKNKLDPTSEHSNNGLVEEPDLHMQDAD
jgi:hypothetical protein